MPQDHTTTHPDPARRLSRLKVAKALTRATAFSSDGATVSHVHFHLAQAGQPEDVKRHLDDLVARGKAEKVGRRYRTAPRD